jgi:Rrf2 family cysteine metabolism transcriptional repressor
MRISTNGRYALRALLDLAVRGEGKPIARQDIAENQQISSEYIAQIFRPLAKAGFIRSTKGPGGGYILSRSANSIRVGDIIRTVEGPIAIVACVVTGMENSCDRISFCATHTLWSNLNKIIEEYLDSVTLEDLKSMSKNRYQEVQPCADPVDSILKIVESKEFGMICSSENSEMSA